MAVVEHGFKAPFSVLSMFCAFSFALVMAIVCLEVASAFADAITPQTPVTVHNVGGCVRASPVAPRT